MKFIVFALAIASTTVHSAVVYSGLQNIPIVTTFAGTNVDVENINNATNHGTGEIVGTDINFFYGGVGMMNEANFQVVRTSGLDPYSAAINLPLGSIIGSSSTFASGNGGSGDFGSEHVGSGANQFQPNTDGYIGFRLNGTHYGWMRVSFTFNEPGGLIRDWAYDDSGAEMLAGVVPEPGRAAFLLIGGIALVLRRRLRSTAS